MARPKKYPDELIARGVRLALESGRPIAAVARDLGMHPETLRKRVRQAEADSGTRPDLPSTAERGTSRESRGACCPPSDRSSAIASDSAARDVAFHLNGRRRHPEVVISRLNSPAPPNAYRRAF